MSFRELLVQQSASLGGQLAGQALRGRRAPAAAPAAETERPALREAEALLARQRAYVEQERQTQAETSTGVPTDLFADIEGHQDLKLLLRAALESRRPVHILLVGPPGSGKSLFLQAIARLPRSRYAVGGATSSSGLTGYLLEKPETRLLLIDELDKADPADLYALYSLMESGLVTRLQHRATEQQRREVWVFAAANSPDAIPPALLSRFVRVDLPAYSPQQVEQITQTVLVRREGLPPGRARAIARATAARSGDPRDGIQVGRLAGDTHPWEGLVEQVIPRRPGSKGRPQAVS